MRLHPRPIPFRALFAPLFAACVGAVLFGPAADATAAALWSPEAPLASSEGSRYPVGSRVFTLDLDALGSLLDQAPTREEAPHHSAGLPQIALPMPDGSTELFSFHVAGTMHPELRAKFPEIRLFAGTGRTSQWRTRFELTPRRGFTAAVWSPQGKILIEEVGASGMHGSAWSRDLLPEPDAQPLTCHLESDPETERMLAEAVELVSRGGGVSHGTQLHTYELAVAATGEYTAQYGGTVPGAMTQIGITVNRINEIMGMDWSVLLELIPNNDLVVYTNAATDPYTNGDTFAMLGENHTNLNNVIGNANYDYGHVFGTGGGGVASLGSVCSFFNKGRGVSTSFNTGGETFALLAAHEMGHQFGCHHSFNGDAGNCGPNRTGSAAYEPGSGTTIMSYAGICGSQNITLGSDDYYHAYSMQQAIANITGGTASGCDATSPTNNSPPVAVAGNAGLTLPIDTPFELIGSATDPDGDDMVYSWEEMDLGPAGHPDMPVGDAPIFRSRSPKLVTKRVFPRIQQVLNNNQVIGEILPTYTRNLDFRFVVRDGLGGSHWAATRLEVSDTAGPFLVTSHPTSEILTGGASTLVTWDVANTDNATINCTSVDILLAEDGKNYDHVLATATPNDGAESVTIPNVMATKARIKVKASNNVFFDINDADLEIQTGGVGVDPVVSSTGLRLDPARPNPFRGSTAISYSLPQPGEASLRVFDLAGRLVQVLHDGPASRGSHTITWNGLANTGAPAASGIYFVRLETADGDRRMQRVHLIR